MNAYLANAEDVKGPKGHKTDKQDSWWLAHLFRHAMVRNSFIPPRFIRQLRDLTRRRKQLLKFSHLREEPAAEGAGRTPT